LLASTAQESADLFWWTAEVVAELPQPEKSRMPLKKSDGASKVFFFIINASFFMKI
jgi:hypothetical protein